METHVARAVRWRIPDFAEIQRVADEMGISASALIRQAVLGWLRSGYIRRLSQDVALVEAVGPEEFLARIRAELGDGCGEREARADRQAVDG